MFCPLWLKILATWLWVDFIRTNHCLKETVFTKGEELTGDTGVSVLNEGGLVESFPDSVVEVREWCCREFMGVIPDKVPVPILSCGGRLSRLS